MLNMCTFDVLLVCHSLGQSVSHGYSLIHILLIHEDYSFSQKILQNTHFIPYTTQHFISQEKNLLHNNIKKKKI